MGRFLGRMPQSKTEKPKGSREGAEGPIESPKAFISYSWSTPEYIDRVAELAARLRSHGVDVVFDKYDVAEGDDVHAFMEQAVTDPSVSHVLILCDPTYAAKADGREGGVGKETLIISPSVYQKAKQRRVIPIIMQRDDSGAVVVPTYLNGRVFIDLSEPTREAEGYEQLVRVLFGKPQLVPPPKGEPPEFLSESYVALRTTAAFQLFRAALMASKPASIGHFGDYLNRLESAYAEEEIKEFVPTHKRAMGCDHSQH
jgi:hypothetical protein